MALASGPALCRRCKEIIPSWVSQTPVHRPKKTHSPERPFISICALYLLLHFIISSVPMDGWKPEYQYGETNVQFGRLSSTVWHLPFLSNELRSPMILSTARARYCYGNGIPAQQTQQDPLSRTIVPHKALTARLLTAGSGRYSGVSRRPRS